MAGQPSASTPRVSLAEANYTCPDNHFGSTVGNLFALYGVDEYQPCLSLERVPLGGIDQNQSMDDPTARESVREIESMCRSIRAGKALPPIYTVHHPVESFPYFLLEGMHRFSAHLNERSDNILAWVAHVNCCERASEVETDE